MAAVERIEQDIAALHKAAKKLAEEFQQAYSEYLQALGQVLRQQLILSSYHVCTQGYPTQFLALSLSQRQALQQALQDLAKHAQARLVALLQKTSVQQLSAAESEPGISEAELEQLAEPQKLEDVETTAEDATSPLPTVLELTEWQEALEAAIAHEIRSVSSKANRLLQQAGILPNKLPEFLKATSNISSEQMEAISQNMMELLMEAQSRDGSEDNDEENSSPPIAMVVQLVTVHLKLSEIEFADGTTTILRNRLRSLAARLKTLKQAFRKKERELAIAQAEAAWRSAWYEG
ncbi:MAG: hypothetical protein NW224_05835 [Leptolyngbyaceae cyanobacterium bins.302]|nr:hypothetical protein [Leptolyngbyaceae cyanobacterium bins.302]